MTDVVEIPVGDVVAEIPIDEYDSALSDFGVLQ